MVVHRSKIDAWLVAILAISVLAAMYGAIVVSAQGSIGGWILAALIAGVGAALPVWLLLSTRYTIQKDKLLIQCGPFKWRIAVAEINEIAPTSNPLSSPALSLDRLRIDYAQGASLMISPRDKEKFISDLDAARRGTPSPA